MVVRVFKNIKVKSVVGPLTNVQDVQFILVQSKILQIIKGKFFILIDRQVLYLYYHKIQIHLKIFCDIKSSVKGCSNLGKCFICQ